jgi:hypothetical protein
MVVAAPVIVACLPSKAVCVAVEIGLFASDCIVYIAYRPIILPFYLKSETIYRHDSIDP